MWTVNDTMVCMRKKKLITAEDLLNLVSVGDPQISPDGSQVLYTKKIAKDVRNHISIWVALAKGNDTPRALTNEGKDSMPRWSPDGTKVAFVRGGKSGANIYVIDMHGGEPAQLSNFPEGVISAMKWCPNGKSLAVSYRQTDKPFTNALAESRKKTKESDPPFVTENLWYRLDGDGYFGHARFHLYIVDASTGKYRNVWKRDNLGFFSFTWSPKGDKIAITTNTSKKSLLDSRQTKVVVLDVASGKSKALPNCTKGPKDAITWSPNGRWLAWAGREGEESTYSTENLQLFVASASTGNAKNLTSNIDRCLMAVTLCDTGDVNFSPQICWTGDSKSLLVRIGWHGEEHICKIHRTGNKLTPITLGNCIYSMGNLSDDGKSIAMMHGSATTPPEICLGRLSARGLNIKQITNENTKWCEEHAIASPRDRWIKSKDKTNIHCWVMSPPKESKQKKSRPAILQIHGGPHCQYGWAFFHEFQCLASAGYTIVYTNPRGSKGYGVAHCEPIKNDWGGADWVDMQAIISMMKRSARVNPRNMGVMGGSYGGYMTNWIVGNCDDFKGAITDRCVSNLVSMGGNSDFPDKQDGYFGGNCWSRPEDRWRQSPIRHFDNATTPMLIIHSEGDLRCNIEQSEQVFTALKLQDIEARFVRYPRSTSHGLSRGGPVDLRIHRIGEILRWWKRQLR